MTHSVQLGEDGSLPTISIAGAERNALDRAAIEELRALLEDLGGRAATRAIVLTGSDGTFCGGRIRDYSLTTPAEISTDLAPILELNGSFDACPVPIISAVERVAFGFGFGLAMLSDYAVAGEGATFALTELAHGIPPLIVLSYLFRLAPYKVAFELALTGRELNAREALRLGLVTEVVPDGATLKRAGEIGALAAAADPQAIALLRSYARQNAALVDFKAAESGAARIAELLASSSPS